MNRPLCVVFYLCFVFKMGITQFTIPSGPFTIQVKQMEKCSDEGTRQVDCGTRIDSLGGGRYVYNAPMQIRVPVDKDMKFEAELQSWGNGGYKMFTKKTLKNCQEMLSLAGDTIKGIFKYAGYTLESCPIPVGNYSVQNYPMTQNINFLPVMIYNKYRLYLDFYYKRIKVGCLVYYLDIVPKMNV